MTIAFVDITFTHTHESIKSEISNKIILKLNLYAMFVCVSLSSYVGEC